MRKIILTILSITFLSNIYATGSIYDQIDKYDKLSDNSYYSSLNQLTYNTLSNDLLLSDGYLDKISKKVLNNSISLYIFKPDQVLSYNSKVAHSYNDGSFWQGRGFNGKTTFGFYLESDVFTLTVLPEFWFAQNQDFSIIETTSSSGFGDYWTIFDNLQRFGDEFYTDFNLGQSELRFLILENFTVGISNQNITLGPGVHNNIVLGSQGAGFPHLDYGTLKPIKIFNLGTYEFRTTYGILEESEFFDDDDSNNYGWYSGISTGFSPSLLPNFKLGFNHYYTKPLSDFEALDLLRHIPGVDTENSGTDLKDSMVSLTYDYAIPSVGFRVYGEIARNDQFSMLMDLWNEPEHTMATTYGFSQNVYTFMNSNKIVVSGEFTALQQQRTVEHRNAGPYYRHGWAGWTQGYSNKGQLLGSTIGPGSNSQLGEISYIHKKGMINFIYQRIAHDKDYYYVIYKAQPLELQNSQDTPIRAYTEAIIGIEALYQFSNFDLFGRFEYNNYFNYNNVRIDDFTNIYVKLGISYGF